MKYRIVQGFSLAELEARVNKLLLEGWKLQGGISFFYIAIGEIDVYTQAMIFPDISFSWTGSDSTNS